MKPINGIERRSTYISSLLWISFLEKVFYRVEKSDRGAAYFWKSARSDEIHEFLVVLPSAVWYSIWTSLM